MFIVFVLILWFDVLVQYFIEFVLFGNGCFGVLVFGGVEEECIIFNEIGMWFGLFQDVDCFNVVVVLLEICCFLFEGKNVEVEEFVVVNFICVGVGLGCVNGVNFFYGFY